MGSHHRRNSRGVLGFTTAHPPTSAKELAELSASDPAGLVDRPEFWILGENVFDERLNELDEIRIVIDKLGEIYLWRNNLSEESKRLIAFADPSIPFYPFLFLNGRINALSVFGLISDRYQPPAPTPTPAPGPAPADEDKGLCKICYADRANCVLIPCGHVFFCMDCKEDYEASRNAGECPICRKQYVDSVEISDD